MDVPVLVRTRHLSRPGVKCGLRFKMSRRRSKIMAINRVKDRCCVYVYTDAQSKYYTSENDTRSVYIY